MLCFLRFRFVPCSYSEGSPLFPFVANCCYATMELLFRRNKRLRNKGEQQRRKTKKHLAITDNPQKLPVVSKKRNTETVSPPLDRKAKIPSSLRFTLCLRFRLLFLPSASFHALIPKARLYSEGINGIRGESEVGGSFGIRA